MLSLLATNCSTFSLSLSFVSPFHTGRKGRTYNPTPASVYTRRIGSQYTGLRSQLSARGSGLARTCRRVNQLLALYRRRVVCAIGLCTDEEVSLRVLSAAQCCTRRISVRAEPGDPRVVIEGGKKSVVREFFRQFTRRSLSFARVQQRVRHARELALSLGAHTSLFFPFLPALLLLLTSRSRVR